MMVHIFLSLEFSQAFLCKYLFIVSNHHKITYFHNVILSQTTCLLTKIILGFWATL